MKCIRSLVASVLVASSLVAAPVMAETVKSNAVVAKSPVAEAAVAPAAATVNINTADAATLADRMNGIGIKKAQAIVSYREQNGPFKSVDDLVNVAGIGQSTLEKNRSVISVN